MNAHASRQPQKNLPAGQLEKFICQQQLSIRSAVTRKPRLKTYNPKKKGVLSYHPQLAFWADSKEILQAWFRTGSAYTSNGIVDFVKQLVAHLPKRIRLIIRADSGYFVGALLDLLDRLGHGYLIKVKLKNLVTLLMAQQWTPLAGQPDWEQCAFKHRCGGWAVFAKFGRGPQKTA